MYFPKRVVKHDRSQILVDAALFLKNSRMKEAYREMKQVIAIPTENKKVCAHFGHCQAFAVFEVDNNIIDKVEYIQPPEHQPGTYPKFLMKLGVTAVLAGGMGMKAQQLFAEQNIPVYTGISANDPAEAVRAFVGGNLETGSNACDH